MLMLFVMMRIPLQMVPRMSGQIVQLQVSMGRIAAFMQLPEVETDAIQTEGVAPGEVVVKDGRFDWQAPKKKSNDASKGGKGGKGDKGGGKGGGKGLGGKGGQDSKGGRGLGPEAVTSESSEGDATSEKVENSVGVTATASQESSEKETPEEEEDVTMKQLQLDDFQVKQGTRHPTRVPSLTCHGGIQGSWWPWWVL